MNKSESIGKLAEALSKAQGAMRNAVKDADNPYFKSKYADLASVADACRDELAVNGLAVSQLPETKDGDVVLHYILMHTSGEWLSGELTMTPVKKDPQGIGSTITYARRYSLASIAGIATEDDDGNAASGNGSGGRAPKNVERTTADIPLKSAAHTPVQAVEHSKGPGPTEAAETHSTAANQHSAEEPTVLPATSAAVDYISVKQQKEFHAACRGTFPPESRSKVDNATYTWLMDNGYLKQNGEPSASAIPVKDWPAAKDKAAKWVAVQ